MSNRAGYLASQSKNKYHAIRHGIYASRKEARRAEELKLLEKAGEISNLQMQVTFELVPKQVDADGKCVERSVKYIADFVYNDMEGKQVVEDSKSKMTQQLDVYILKRKLMLYVHGIKVLET